MARTRFALILYFRVVAHNSTGLNIFYVNIFYYIELTQRHLVSMPQYNVALTEEFMNKQLSTSDYLSLALVNDSQHIRDSLH